MTEDLPYKPLHFRPGSLRFAPGSKYSNLIGTMSVFNCLYFGHFFSQMELKFVNNSYFKQLFQNLRLKLQYSKNRTFVTSHFGTLLDDTGLYSIKYATYRMSPELEWKIFCEFCGVQK